MDDQPPLKGAWLGSHDPLLSSMLAIISPEWLSESRQILYAGGIYQMIALE